MVCQKEFASRHPNQKLCSPECFKVRKNQTLKAWRIVNKEHIREYKKIYHKEVELINPSFREQRRLKAQEYQVDRNIYNKTWRWKLKQEVLSAYSKEELMCACCGEKSLEFLTIDHIDGNGHNDRKVHGSGVNFYHWLKKNNYPKGFRVLCYNCNCSLGHLGYCPHQEKKVVGE